MSFRNTVITNPKSVMAADSPGHSFTCWSSGTSFPEGLFSKGVECMCTDWFSRLLHRSDFCRIWNDTRHLGDLRFVPSHCQSCYRFFNLIFSKNWVLKNISDSFLFSISSISALIISSPFLRFTLDLFCSSFCSFLRWGVSLMIETPPFP